MYRTFCERCQLFLGYYSINICEIKREYSLYRWKVSKLGFRAQRRSCMHFWAHFSRWYLNARLVIFRWHLKRRGLSSCRMERAVRPCRTAWLRSWLIFAWARWSSPRGSFPPVSLHNFIFYFSWGKLSSKLFLSFFSCYNNWESLSNPSHKLVLRSDRKKYWL